MKKLFVLLLAGGGLLLSRPALAQVYPWMYPAYSHHGCCHCCCQRDTTTYTERTNRTAGLVGPTALVGRQGEVRAGLFLELGRAVAPRLTVGGNLLVGFNRASPTNFGTEATAPAYSLYALTGRGRYQLLNGRRWRVETLAGLGLGAAWLVDLDQQVYYQSGRSSGYRPATVAFAVYPLAEVGLSTSWKVGREFWLTPQLSYAQQVLGNRLGAAGEFSHWNATVAATVPWGYRPR